MDFFALSGTVQSLADGHHVDDAGMLISCTDVDVRAQAARRSGCSPSR